MRLILALNSMKESKKNSSKLVDENRAKILQKSQKGKMIHRRDLCTKISYIERIKRLQGVKTITTSTHSLKD
jgi:hypothetical protein